MKKYKVNYKVNIGEIKTESVWVDTIYNLDPEQMIKIELNETVENNIGIDKIAIIKYS